MSKCKKMGEVCTIGVPESLFAGTLTDPHSVLGIHDWNGDKIIRVYDPLAVSVEVLTGRDFSKSTPMDFHGNGLFTLVFRRKNFFAYRLRKRFADRSVFE